ncbi:MAG TPA: ComEC/Rec2 family competence protein, partial [Thermomicrobiales bacterium]|nr:ComEC/Rec2 family competence protein [Thermomicrobiales bacterium]
VEFRWQDATGIVRDSTLYMPPAPRVGRGDRVEVVGETLDLNGKRVFADGVRIVKQTGRLETERRRIRTYLTESIQRHVPGTPGSLTLGLLIGDDTALTNAERDDLRHAGLSHLTAVSGWNVTLVTGTVGLLFLRLGLRGWRWTVLQLIALAGYVWIVGLDPPVTRAAIMVVAGLVAIRLGRPAHSLTVLVLSASLMVAVSPASLASLAFQLSVLATLGLIVASRLTAGFEGWRAIALTPVIATAATGVITAPLLASEFGTLSLATVPANILAAPLVPAATIAGIAVIALGPVTPLATAAGWVAWSLCALLLGLARTLASVPHGYHEFAPLSDAQQAGLYAALLVIVAAVLPEGRLLLRAAVNWARQEPTGAALSASAACVALLAATFTV